MAADDVMETLSSIPARKVDVKERMPWIHGPKSKQGNPLAFLWFKITAPVFTTCSSIDPPYHSRNLGCLLARLSKKLSRWILKYFWGSFYPSWSEDRRFWTVLRGRFIFMEQESYSLGLFRQSRQIPSAFPCVFDYFAPIPTSTAFHTLLFKSIFNQPPSGKARGWNPNPLAKLKGSRSVYCSQDREENIWGVNKYRHSQPDPLRGDIVNPMTGTVDI